MSHPAGLSEPGGQGHPVTPEPFLSALQNMGVEFLHGVENFLQGEVLSMQAAYNFLHD